MEVPRVRVSRACQSCRLLRTKCSGHQPCESCAAAGQVCEYAAPKKRGPKGPTKHEGVAALAGNSRVRGWSTGADDVYARAWTAPSRKRARLSPEPLDVTFNSTAAPAASAGGSRGGAGGGGGGAGGSGAGGGAGGAIADRSALAAAAQILSSTRSLGQPQALGPSSSSSSSAVSAAATAFNGSNGAMTSSGSAHATHAGNGVSAFQPATVLPYHSSNNILPYNNDRALLQSLPATIVAAAAAHAAAGGAGKGVSSSVGGSNSSRAGYASIAVQPQAVAPPRAGVGSSASSSSASPVASPVSGGQAMGQRGAPGNSRGGNSNSNVGKLSSSGSGNGGGFSALPAVSGSSVPDLQLSEQLLTAPIWLQPDDADRAAMAAFFSLTAPRIVDAAAWQRDLEYLTTPPQERKQGSTAPAARFAHAAGFRALYYCVLCVGMSLNYKLDVALRYYHTARVCVGVVFSYPSPPLASAMALLYLILRQVDRDNSTGGDTLCEFAESITSKVPDLPLGIRIIVRVLYHRTRAPPSQAAYSTEPSPPGSVVIDSVAAATERFVQLFVYAINEMQIGFPRCFPPAGRARALALMVEGLALCRKYGLYDTAYTDSIACCLHTIFIIHGGEVPANISGILACMDTVYPPTGPGPDPRAPQPLTLLAAHTFFVARNALMRMETLIDASGGKPSPSGGAASGGAAPGIPTATAADHASFVLSDLGLGASSTTAELRASASAAAVALTSPLGPGPQALAPASTATLSVNSEPGQSSSATASPVILPAVAAATNAATAPAPAAAATASAPAAEGGSSRANTGACAQPGACCSSGAVCMCGCTCGSASAAAAVPGLETCCGPERLPVPSTAAAAVLHRIMMRAAAFLASSPLNTVPLPPEFLALDALRTFGIAQGTFKATSAVPVAAGPAQPLHLRIALNSLREAVIGARAVLSHAALAANGLSSLQSQTAAAASAGAGGAVVSSSGGLTGGAESRPSVTPLPWPAFNGLEGGAPSFGFAPPSPAFSIGSLDSVNFSLSLFEA